MSTPLVATGYRFLTDEEFDEFSGFIETRLGIKMPRAKKVLLEARLQKRLRILGLASFAEYRDYLFGPDGAKKELIAFIDEVTTNKTDFFRDPGHFEALAGLLKSGGVGSGGGISCWSVAASTGEEPYTLAMVCEEHRRLHPGFRWEVAGTDISMKVLKAAVKGVYVQESAAPIPEALRHRYLLRGTGDMKGFVRVSEELRKRVSFYRLNLMSEDYGLDGPFDVIFCRNVLIYFDSENQRAILWRIFRRLAPGGCLFMGPTEGLLANFLPLEKIGSSVFRRAEASDG